MFCLRTLFCPSLSLILSLLLLAERLLGLYFSVANSFSLYSIIVVFLRLHCIFFGVYFIFRLLARIELAVT